MIYSKDGEMRSRWQIAFYKDPSGSMPVMEYMFTNTNEKDLDVMIGDIQRLSRAGQTLVETKAVNHIDGPIFELRPNRHRIMYAEDKPNSRFVLLSAFLKATQKTPPIEIEKAHRNWADYLRTGNCEVFRLPVEDF
jgi:phage-related protein